MRNDKSNACITMTMNDLMYFPPSFCAILNLAYDMDVFYSLNLAFRSSSIIVTVGLVAVLTIWGCHPVSIDVVIDSNRLPPPVMGGLRGSVSTSSSHPRHTIGTRIDDGPSDARLQDRIRVRIELGRRVNGDSVTPRCVSARFQLEQ